MTDKKLTKGGRSRRNAPPQEERMVLAEKLMRKDHEILSAIAQMPVAREVMSRRRRALRDLSK